MDVKPHHPTYRLLANQADITDVIRERLVSLRYTDEAGFNSDVLEIVLADHETAKPIQIPPTGALLDLSFGYEGLIREVGKFIVDEIELAGWPGEMTIRARAAPFDTSKGGIKAMQTQKTRVWPKGLTLGVIVKKIAKENGLNPSVSKELSSVKVPAIEQASESDLNFLARLARKYDSVVKPTSGQLVLAKVGSSKTVSGQTMPSVSVDIHSVSQWRVVQSTRETAGTIVAYWHETKAAKKHEIKAGTGEPVKRLKMYYPTQSMALAAARAELAKRERHAVTLSLTCIGSTDLVAEASLVLSGFRPGLPADWVIKRADHQLSGNGYTTTIEAEIPNE
jgi:phage protein D